MPSIAKGISEDLPSLSYAYRLTRKASRLGFDWPDLAGALKKMDEELREFHEALALPPHHLGVPHGSFTLIRVNMRPPTVTSPRLEKIAGSPHRLASQDEKIPILLLHY